MIQKEIEVCHVCHFKLPKIMSYHGTIKCHCGKIVYTTENITCRGRRMTEKKFEIGTRQLGKSNTFGKKVEMKEVLIKTFEEEFPEIALDVNKTYPLTGEGIKNLITDYQNSIIKNCKSNRKVKEAINKWKMRSDLPAGFHSEEMISVQILLRELDYDDI